MLIIGTNEDHLNRGKPDACQNELPTKQVYLLTRM